MPVEDGTDLPPVPPTAPPPIPLGDPVLGRHVAPDPERHGLLTADGVPISPTTPSDPLIKRRGDLPASQTSVAEIGQDVAELTDHSADLETEIRRVGRDVLIVGLIAVLALIVALVVGYLTFAYENARIQDQHRQLTTDIQQAQINEQHRDALCRTLTERLGSFSNAARTTYFAGPTAYDQDFVALRQSFAVLGCGT